jgi:Na+:H+ antiporter, NhaC family
VPDSPTRPQPSLAAALIPVVVLVALLGSAVALYGDGAASGPNQLALLLAAMVAAAIGWRQGYDWDTLQRGIVHGISLSTGAILILLLVGR